MNRLIAVLDVEELMAVYRAFYSTRTNGILHICKVEKIMNPALYQLFEKNRQQYEDYHNRDCIVEAFHGTQLSKIPNILEKNLLPSKCKRDRYGQGVYFSRSSQYASNFCKNEEKVMLLCYVLVGNAVEVREFHAPDYNLPLVDTFVDNQKSMNIIVKWKENTFFPAYLIHLRSMTFFKTTTSSITHEIYKNKQQHPLPMHIEFFWILCL